MSKDIYLGHRHFDPRTSDLITETSIREVEEIGQALRLGTQVFINEGFGNSTNLQRCLRDALNLQGFVGKTPFVYLDGRSVPANFEVDFFRQSAAPDGLTHIAGEFAFDNRQAIGTNILKIDLCLRKLSFSSGEESTLAVLVTFTRDSRNLANWDNGVADFQDYEDYLSQGYARYLTHPLHLFGIGYS